MSIWGGGYAQGAGAIAQAAAQIAAAEIQAAAQREVAKLNADAQREINAQQLLWAKEQQGYGGLPINLPLYTGDLEAKGLFPAARGVYDAIGAAQGTPEEQAAAYLAITGQAQPQLDAVQKLADNIFSGGLTRDRLAEFQPVAAAATTLAQTQKGGILESLTERLNALQANQTRQGYTGGGSAQSTAALRTSIPFRQQAAGVEAATALQNRQGMAGIQEKGRQEALASMGLPLQLAQQSAAVRSLPATSLANAWNTRLGTLDFFKRRAVAAPNLQAPFTAYAPPIGLGALAGVGNYFGQQSQNAAVQKLIDQLNKQNVSVYGAPGGSTTGTGWNEYQSPVYGGDDIWA